MSGAPLRFVLGLLRRIKSDPGMGLGHSAFAFVQKWAGDGGYEAQFKMLISIQQSLADARESIAKSGLSDEAKVGLFETLDSVIKAFSLEQMQSALTNHIKSLDASLTLFSVVASAAQYDIPSEFGEERDSLVNDLSRFLHEIEAYEIDDRLRDLTRRQIRLIIALLNNAEAIGVEAAMAAYYEMVIRLRNRSGFKETKAADDTSKFWATVKSWSERIDALSKIYDVGNRLLPYIDKIPQIPGF